MVDILLIQPPIRDFYLTRKRTIPYGLACLAGALRQAGFTVEIFDGLATAKSRIVPTPQEMSYLDDFYGRPDRSPFGLFHQYRHYGYSFEHIGRMAQASGAFLVGIASLFTPYHREALATARAVKAHLPTCRIVLGGHHPTALPEAAMQETALDYLIRGEGEEALPRLAKALQCGDQAAIPMIPGIVYRDHGGEVIIGRPATVKELDRCPLPATDLIKQRFYRRRQRGSVAITASRGCSLKCSYCCIGCAAHLPYRKRKVASILAELDAQCRGGPLGLIDFEDENLSMDRAWFASLLASLKGWSDRHGSATELRAMNGLMPSSLDEGLLAAMGAAGFKELNLSLGTTNPEQLKRFRRPDMRLACDQTLLWAEKQGLTVVAYIIAAAPFQRPQDSIDDLIYLAARRVLAGVSLFYPAPGSEAYDRCDQLNLLPANLTLMRATALPMDHTTGRKEAATILRLGRILNYIKLLRDHNMVLPTASAPPKQLSGETNRQEIGRLLLAAFLKDGRIRGVTPQGEVYAHRISTTLTRLFLDRLMGISIRGTR